MANGRMAFRIKSGMVNRIQMNYIGSYKNNLSCEKYESGENESQCHAMVCSGWSEQRTNERTKMSDMIVFFRRLLEEKGGKNTKEGMP